MSNDVLNRRRREGARGGWDGRGDAGEGILPSVRGVEDLLLRTRPCGSGGNLEGIVGALGGSMGFLERVGGMVFVAAFW